MVFESQFLTHFPCYLVATDEAGRGPLAGPVVAGAVAFKVTSREELAALIGDLRAKGVGDSKKLTEKKRNELAAMAWPILQSTQVEFDAASIDRLNILQASMESMKAAAEQVVSNKENLPVVWLIDGNKKPREVNASWQVHAIVKGDSKSALIGLASILAKVHRDRLMQGFHQQYPQYGFNQHAGYPTAAHREAIKRFGPSPIHRFTFKGVREYTAR
jgi:ribonuclease HII